MKRWALCALALIVAWPASASGASAPGAPAPIVLDRPRTEPAVAIDPIDPRVIVVVTNPTYRPDARGEEPAGIFISRDGGTHWDARPAPLAAPYTIASDPSVSFSPSGALYIAYEAVPGSFCGSTVRTAVLLTRSINAGRSFSAPTIVDSNADNDKPYMAAAAAPGGRGDAVYIAWIRFHAGHDVQIAFARSLDSGRHFSSPAIVSQGPAAHVAPQVAAARGRVYVGWATGVVLGSTRPTQEWLESRASPDAGAHFGATGRTATFWGLPGLEAPGSLRLFNGPSLAVGPRAVYMAWAEARTSAGVPVLSNGNVQAAIALSRSEDGVRWSAPLYLNDSGRGDRFEPQIAVASGGAVLASYYDRRRDGRDLDLYVAVARDSAAGLRVGNSIRITAAASPLSAIPFIPPGSPCLAQGRFFGDYIGLAALGDRAAFAWTASSLAYPGQTDVRALVSPIALLGAA